MIQTVNFKTKTVIIDRENSCNSKSFFPIALDIGYSGVKGFSPIKVSCFPSYAKKADENVLQLIESSKYDIQFRDETGLWYVGELAQLMTDKDDTNENISTLYGRKRYDSPMFKVLAKTGMGLNMLANKYGDATGKTIILQTGLPPAYAKTDAPHLRKAIAGRHKFELKIGNGQWTKFEFELPEDNIRIMAQPQGSLVSFTIDSKGKRIPDYAKYLSGNVSILVDDAGFGTDDYFNIKNGRVEMDRTYTRNDLGMKRVFEETAKEFYKRYGVEMPVHTLQNFLQKGEYPKFDAENMKQNMISFADILEEKNREICMEAIEYMKSTFNYLQDYQYLLITGGTGAARFNIIKDYFSKMTTLKVIGANQNSDLPHIFSNVRGYYFYLNQRLGNNV